MESIDFHVFTSDFGMGCQVMPDWTDRTFFSQMNDVWGEANKAVESSSEGRTDKLIRQLKVFSDICSIIYMNPNITDGAKFELREAEWELYDFCLWDNELHNTPKSVMRWFDQWLYDINYDLL